MNSAPKLVAPSGEAILEKDARVKEYTKRANALIMQIPKYFSDAYDSAAGKIKSLADTLENIYDHQTYESVHRNMAEARNGALDSFFSNFANLLTNSNGGAELDAERALNFHTSDLCLITESELQQQLKLESGFHSAMEGFEKMLIDSSWRFHPELNELKLAGMIDSIRPGQVAQLIHHALDSSVKDVQTARVVHRYIGWDIYSRLFTSYHSLTPLLYDVCNLMQQNIAQRFIAEIQDAQSDANVSLVRNEASLDVSGLINSWEVPPLMEVEYEAGSFSVVDQNISENKSVNTLKTDELSELLKNLTVNSQLQSVDGISPVELRSALKSSLESLSSEGILTVIDRVSENIINLVSSFFANITNNSDFVPEVALQISRIQIPVMRLSLGNSKVFQQEDHVTRQYINALGALGVRIASPSEEGYFALRDSVDRVLNDFDGEETFFESELQSLNAYIETSVYGVKWAAEMLNLSEDSDKQNVNIKNFLSAQSALLAKELKFHKLARFVWSEILNRIVLSNGVYSEKWRNAVELYSSILWSTQADSSDIGKREVLRRLPGIVQGVKAMFAEQGIHPRVRDEMLNQMIQIHLTIIRGVSGSEIDDEQISSVEVFNCLQEDIFVQQVEDEIDNENLELAKQTAPVMQPVIRPEDASPSLFWRFDQISPFDDQEAEAVGEAVAEDAEVEPLTDQLVIMAAENEAEWSVIGQSTGEEEMKRLFKLVGGMSVGSIIDFNRKGKRHRYQLVKKSISLGQYTFRDFEGSDFTSMSKAQLVLCFIRGEAKRVGESRLFENSLATAVASIQRR